MGTVSTPPLFLSLLALEAGTLGPLGEGRNTGRKGMEGPSLDRPQMLRRQSPPQRGSNSFRTDSPARSGPGAKSSPRIALLVSEHILSDFVTSSRGVERLDSRGGPCSHPGALT